MKQKKEKETLPDKKVQKKAKSDKNSEKQVSRKQKKEEKKEQLNKKKKERRMARKEKREKKVYGMSLRTFVTLHVIFLCAVVMLLYSVAANQMYKVRYKEQIEKSVMSQCDSLAYELKTNNMSLRDPVDLTVKMETMATSLYGRVMVVNQDYKILMDTYGNQEGAYLVHDGIMNVMTGHKKEILSSSDRYVQYIAPIKAGEEILGVIVIQASTESIQTISKRVERRNIFLFIGLMFVCFVFAFIIGNTSAKGIKKINRQMEEARDGHLEDQIPEQGFKEFKQLTESYNRTINKLMTLDSTRQEFVSNVSHELKTPITSMKVLADSLIQNEEADLPMYKEFMSDIVDEIDRESKIISDLLTLVKMDKKSAEMNIEEISINGLLEVILKRVTPIAKSRGIEITYESYRDVTAFVDEVKLSLALTNIIENAVKYNVDNGWVKVTLNADHKNFHIKVADSGVGIPDDCKDQVFERFYRVDKARSRDTGGTGLGLAITKSVIQMHKGSIKLYSESGEGTTFTIKIPLHTL